MDALRPFEAAVDTPAMADAGLWFIGRIRTPWPERGQCPRRGNAETGPECRIEIAEPWTPALQGVAGKEWLQILYWMHLSRRDAVLQNPNFGGSATGTFSIRSPLRPNPIASSNVRLLAVQGPVLVVRGLDCVDGTSLLDIKPLTGASG